MRRSRKADRHKENGVPANAGTPLSSICSFVLTHNQRSPVRIRPQAPKSNSREGVAFLFETTNRCIMHETPISDHNYWYMHNYNGEISLRKGTSSPKRCLLSNAVAGCRTKMLVFDKLPLHLLSVCGIFDSVKAVRGVYMGNCVPLKLC